MLHFKSSRHLCYKLIQNLICKCLLFFVTDFYNDICSATLPDTIYCYLNINSNFYFFTYYRLRNYPNTHQLQIQMFAVSSKLWSQLSLWGCSVLKVFLGHPFAREINEQSCFWSLLKAWHVDSIRRSHSNENKAEVPWL